MTIRWTIPGNITQIPTEIQVTPTPTPTPTTETVTISIPEYNPEGQIVQEDIILPRRYNFTQPGINMSSGQVISTEMFQEVLSRISTDYTSIVKKKKVKKKIMDKNLIKRSVEPSTIDGAKVFNINRNLIENVSAASRFIDNAIMPRLSKGQDIHIRLRKDTSPTKKEKLYMFFKELVDNSEISGGKVGVSGPNNFTLEAIKGFFPDKLKVTMNSAAMPKPYAKMF